jgi:thioredoxin reductase
MATSSATVSRPESTQGLDCDTIIIGAGISGLYQLYCLRRMGQRVRVFEAGTGVGGTWYWNRYPGCRFDSESYSYGYSFSQELLDEWDWTEHFAPQTETERYLNYVADKFDLRRDIQLRSRVRAAVFDEASTAWEITLEDGSRYRSRYLVTAVGPLSAPTLPRIAGVDDFEGEAYHTGLWPKHPVTFDGKRVAVIGTGATGVQAIQEIAKTAGHLTVFQRTPNWCAPLHNRPIDPEAQRSIKARYPEIFRICRESFGCFIHDADPRRALEVSPEVREAFALRGRGDQDFARDIHVGNTIANQAGWHFDAHQRSAAIAEHLENIQVIMCDDFDNPFRSPLRTRYGGQPQPLINFRPYGIIETRHNTRHAEDVAGGAGRHDIGIIGGAGGDKSFGSLNTCFNQDIPVKTNPSHNLALKVRAQAGEGVGIVIDDRDSVSLPDQKQADLGTNTSTTHDNDFHLLTS